MERLPVMEAGHGLVMDDSLVMEGGLDALHDLLGETLHDLEVGHGNQSWTEGIRYNAQCDGKNHYLYKMDKNAINPKTGKGYSKGRIYVGTLEANRYRCEAYAANWESKHRCGAGRSSDGHGRAEGAPDGGSENDLSARPGEPYRWQDFTVSND
jgi:hypothetical protein